MVVGPLGSFTIVGSASFNLFIISAVCCAGMPQGETRHIQGTRVFMTTTTFALVAYIWTVCMVSWWTPKVVTIAEALITFACMPIMLLVSYGADKKEKGEEAFPKLAKTFSNSRVFGGQRQGGYVTKRRALWGAMRCGGRASGEGGAGGAGRATTPSQHKGQEQGGHTRQEAKHARAAPSWG